MAELFDAYRDSYGEVVQSSIRFSGLKHEFFQVAKADLLSRLVTERGLREASEPVRALDIGCGVASLHPYLEGHFDNLAGCDVSEESIQRARQNNPRVAYTACTSESLPYADAAFDVAFASCVVHHVPPASWIDFFREMRRVVRAGGIACIIEHNPLNPLTRLAVLRCPFDEHAVLLKATKAASLFKDAGFRDIQTEHFMLFPTARQFAKKIERSLASLPLGAQYACSARV